MAGEHTVSFVSAGFHCSTRLFLGILDECEEGLVAIGEYSRVVLFSYTPS